MRNLPWLGLSLLVLGLDQLGKHWAQRALTGRVLRVADWFNLVLAYNEGAAFSFLSEAGGWQRAFFIAVTVVVVPALLVWLLRLPPRRPVEAAALALVIGGALGNLVDRVRLGRVVDFIDWHLGSWHWPAFNLADAAITAGAVLLLARMVLHGGSGQGHGSSR
ncbi:MAG: lipoprotein signal peptidase [Gammaproteobacteria bacterium]|nr:MAG: lipoprotein signal peptidase [Gammaproteobacteria bacterium]